jgi:ectoine hydroxylase-related dioxygenase (phytanoyl-CoA dioxygenase family)
MGGFVLCWGVSFFRDGVVIVPGLLKGELLEKVMSVRTNVNSRFPGKETYDSLAFNLWEQHPVFKDVALASPLAAVAKQLTPSVANGDESLHVINDAFFAFSGQNAGCGWHVDDNFFWPALRGSDGPGLNIWVALDEVTEGGGGLAVAPGSAAEEYFDIREAQFAAGLTCQLAQVDPAMNTRLEKLALIPQMAPGDAIVHTRFLFHRTNPFADGIDSSRREAIAR